jgi:hypothetical protein
VLEEFPSFGFKVRRKVKRSCLSLLVGLLFAPCGSLGVLLRLLLLRLLLGAAVRVGVRAVGVGARVLFASLVFVFALALLFGLLRPESRLFFFFALLAVPRALVGGRFQQRLFWKLARLVKVVRRVLASGRFQQRFFWKLFCLSRRRCLCKRLFLWLWPLGLSASGTSVLGFGPLVSWLLAPWSFALVPWSLGLRLLWFLALVPVVLWPLAPWSLALALWFGSLWPLGSLAPLALCVFLWLVVRRVSEPCPWFLACCFCVVLVRRLLGARLPWPFVCWSLALAPKSLGCFGSLVLGFGLWVSWRLGPFVFSSGVSALPPSAP